MCLRPIYPPLACGAGAWRARPRLEVFPIVVGDPVPSTARSEVRYVDGQRHVARQLAAALGIERLVQVEGDNAGFAEPRAAVAVVAGDDFPEP
jgi:hypothetical protein